MKSQIKSIIKGKQAPDTYYGFIRTNDDGNDYYFKKSDLDDLPIDELSIGQKVEFDPVDKDGKRSVENLTLISDSTKYEKETSKHNIIVEEFQNNLIDSLKQIRDINRSDDFEDAVFLLLKLLGIHKAFQFERQNQAGKADGFFIIENMAVMYDCTLQQDFKSFKEEQIENYINKLNQKSQITFNVQKIDGSVGPKTLQIQGKTKQVWIITKGESKELRDFDSIKIKEISIHDLLDIVSIRIKDTAYDVERLVNDLMLIGK